MSADGDGDVEPPNEPGPKSNPSRWQKGCPSPNPTGRPPKAKTKVFTTLDGVNDGAAAFLRADRRVVGMRDDGDPITLGESLIIHLAKGAATDPRLMKQYHELKEAALKIEQEVRETLLKEAMAYQNKHLRQALYLESQGKKFMGLPHPADIIIEGLEVRIDGPVTEFDRVVVEEAEQRRDLNHEVACDILISENLREETRYDIWKYLRRQHYKLQRLLPRRLKKKFPAWSGRLECDV